MGEQPRRVTNPPPDPHGSEFERNRHAGSLFDGVANRYDFLAQLLSFFQVGLWRRYLISRLEVGPQSRVLDLCTGTAPVALGIAKTTGARVVGVDVSKEMLRQGRHNVSRSGAQSGVSLSLGRAENLGFIDGSFDAVSFTWLLRYVDDPQATLNEVVRVLRPGGTLVSLEFGAPENKLVRNLWNVYTGLALPLATKVVSPGWRYLGEFLGPSITGFYRDYPLQDIREMWVNAGVRDVKVKKLSLGGGVVMWGAKAA